MTLVVDKVTDAKKVGFMGKLSAYMTFFKTRLALLVVFSAIIGYYIGAEAPTVINAVMLGVAGYLLTAGSNGFNQVMEKDLDALMKRTMKRPLPVGTMTVPEGLILASAAAIAGITILFVWFNTLSGILGVLAIFSYVALYTPMKRVSPWAVFVGAFPGAIPPMLGYVAATAKFGPEPGILFAIQFIWQFPHFWAIAWKAHDDYSKAGFKLLPAQGRDHKAAYLIVLYSLFLLPLGALPFAFKFCTVGGLIGCLIASLIMIVPALQFYFDRTEKKVMRVMFASFIYLPIVLILLLIFKT